MKLSRRVRRGLSLFCYAATSFCASFSTYLLIVVNERCNLWQQLFIQLSAIAFITALLSIAIDIHERRERIKHMKMMFSSLYNELFGKE